MKKLFRYLKGYKLQLIIGPFFKLLEAIFELIVPLVMAKIVDIGIKNQDKDYVIKMGIVMIVLGVCGLCFALICQYSAAVASQGVGTMLRNDMYKHISKLSNTEIDKLGTASLITRMTNDINQIQVAVAMLIRLMVRAPFLLVGATVMAISIDLELSLIFIVMSVIVSIILYVIMSKLVPHYKAIQKKLDRVSKITRENLVGARVLRAFGKQKRENANFKQASSELAETSVKVGKISAFLNPLTLAVLNISIVAILWFGGYQVDSGALTQGNIIALTNYMVQISVVLVVVANLVVIFTKAFASAARINEVFDMIPSISDGNIDDIDISNKNTDNSDISTTINDEEKITESNKLNDLAISFENVSFSYPDSNEYVLVDINLDIKKGETLGIIGGTGDGKSTLINLMPRFYDATSGNIYVNGVNVKQYNLKKLRYKFGMVLQKAVVFSGSIYENLKNANEKLTREDAIDALKDAMAYEFVEKMKDGIDAKVLQGGKNLSGGQRQRLTIARALARKPEILVLDDSFSALDYATGDKLLNNLNRLKTDNPNMTLIIISQRYKLLEAADRIVVMDNGTIVGIGPHTELLNSCEEYKEICNSQTEEEYHHE